MDILVFSSTLVVIGTIAVAYAYFRLPTPLESRLFVALQQIAQRKREQARAEMIAQMIERERAEITKAELAIRVAKLQLAVEELRAFRGEVLVARVQTEPMRRKVTLDGELTSLDGFDLTVVSSALEHYARETAAEAAAAEAAASEAILPAARAL